MESSNNSANAAPNTANISSQSLQVSENTNSGKNMNHEMKTRENAPSMKSQSRKGKTKETSPQSVSTSSKAKRSSSKKKKNSGTSSTGCSVLDQVCVFIVWMCFFRFSALVNDLPQDSHLKSLLPL